MTRVHANDSIAEWAAAQRRAMVEQQLRQRGIRDGRVLEAMGAVDRHEFVPAAQQERAYEDHPLPIGGGQTISQPYVVALMLEALDLKGTERVLEVGTGSGYQAVLLARLAADVYTIERDPELAAAAAARLNSLGLGALVHVVAGDGSLGYPAAAPYDAIIVAAAAPGIPPALLDQLADGGRLVIPVGSLHSQDLRLIRKFGPDVATRVLGQCRFVPLTGSRGWRLD
jgi:protein-L-isoaspartate(D-aspartate) O-methyltransferase